MSFWVRQRAERGAVLIHVGVALVALMGFSVLAIDYGVLWASRRQAQNAADAAALAAAGSMAYNPSNDPTVVEADARTAAAAIVALNPVWGQPPKMDPAVDVSFPTCPPGAPGPPDTCVRVDVYRNQDEGNPLPTFFGRLIGVPNQGVRATATAQVLTGNSVRCLKPWAIPDKWWDLRDEDGVIDEVWTFDDRFDRYVQNGVNAGELLEDPRDVYVPYGETVEGRSFSGYDPDSETGMQVTLKWGNPHQAIGAGWYFPIDLPLAGQPDTGGARYEANIAGCHSDPVHIGDMVWNEPGGMVGPTKHGMETFIAQDPDAHWVDGEGVVDSNSGALSPRIVPIAVFNVDEYMTQAKNAGKFQLRVMNILGFFIEDITGSGDVTGRLMQYPGQYDGSSTAEDEASFLRVIILVR